MGPDRARRDVNNSDSLTVVSNDGQYTPMSVWGNPATHALLTQDTGTGQLVPFSYDYISYTNTSATIDTYVYKTGGSGGATVATITITFTDSTKAQFSSVART